MTIEHMRQLLSDDSVPLTIKDRIIIGHALENIDRLYRAGAEMHLAMRPAAEICYDYGYDDEYAAAENSMALWKSVAKSVR